MSDPDNSNMAAGSNASTFGSEKLLELNKKQNLSYAEVYDFIADMEIYCKVGKEEESRLKIEVEKKEAELAYKTQIVEVMHQLDEELVESEKRSEELLKMKKLNKELRTEIYDLKKQRILEREKQEKILDARWNKVYQEAIKLNEHDPLVIKRNKLRNQNAKLKFQIAFLKQKNEDIEKRAIQFKNIEKRLLQNKIIKFVEAMVKYNKKQKEKEIKKSNISKQNKTQELNLAVTTEKNGGNIVLPPSKQLNLHSTDRSQNDFTQETLSIRNISNKMNLMESFKLSIKSLELPSFDPKKYLNMNFLPTSKLEMPKVVSNIHIPKPNVISILPKIDKLTKPVPEKLLNPNNQKQPLKRPMETQEPKAKKVTVFPEINSSTEAEESISENKKPSQSDTVISSSQDSKKNIENNQNLSKNIPQNVEEVPNKPLQPKQMMNSQIFNFPTIIPVKPMTEIQKPPSLGQMFNLPSTLKKVETVSQKPNSTEFLKKNYTQNQMFNIATGAPKRTENVPDTPHVSSAAKPMETKSPYFPNQSSQNDQSSLSTSTDNIDQVVNVSSDQHPSQISGEEYFEASENVQMQEEIDPNMMEYNNADPNMIDYFGSNPALMQDMGEEPVTSPYSLRGFQSPPNEEHLRINQQINTPTPVSNNPFSVNQSSNNFFDFGQPSNTKSNIFNFF